MMSKISATSDSAATAQRVAGRFHTKKAQLASQVERNVSGPGPAGTCAPCLKPKTTVMPATSVRKANPTCQPTRERPRRQLALTEVGAMAAMDWGVAASLKSRVPLAPATAHSCTHGH